MLLKSVEDHVTMVQVRSTILSSYYINFNSVNLSPFTIKTLPSYKMHFLTKISLNCHIPTYIPHLIYLSRRHCLQGLTSCSFAIAVACYFLAFCIHFQTSRCAKRTCSLNQRYFGALPYNSSLSTCRWCCAVVVCACEFTNNSGKT